MSEAENNGGSNKRETECVRKLIREGEMILRQVLKEHEVQLVLNSGSDEARKFVGEHLTEEEINVIQQDFFDKQICLAVVKSLMDDGKRFCAFDSYFAKREFYGMYMRIQRDWIKRELALHGGEMSVEDLIRDSRRYKNPERYRAYFLLRYPDTMEKRDEKTDE